MLMPNPAPFRLTSVFLVATSVGAQAFKIPAAACIEGEPRSLMRALAAATAFLLAAFAASFALAKHFKGSYEVIVLRFIEINTMFSSGL